MFVSSTINLEPFVEDMRGDRPLFLFKSKFKQMLFIESTGTDERVPLVLDYWRGAKEII
jgi:hypothetical protein